MKRFLVPVCCLIWLLLSQPAAPAQDDQYVQIYTLIQEADSLHAQQQSAAALKSYRQALTQLERFQRTYPDWNTSVVKYRLSFLSAIVTELEARTAEISAAASTNTPPATASADTEQLTSLQQQIRQLQSDNTALESKLREALQLQPASVDPQALARVQQENEILQKENSLLKVTLAERPVQPGGSAEARAIAQLKKQLEDAARKSAEQETRAKELSAEKTELENKLASMIPAAWNATNLQATQKALDAANQKLSDQARTVSQLEVERSGLQERLRLLSQEGEALAAVRSENEILKRQLEEFKSASGNAGQQARELAEARTLIAVLRSDQTVLRLEKAAIEQRIEELARKSAPPEPRADTVSAARLKRVQDERDELQKKFTASQRELSALKTKGPGAKVQELEGEIQLLRTRLAVMETQKVPYTEEEQAVMRKAEAQLTEAKPARKSAREIPPGSMALVAEAQKDFAARRYVQAEEKYQQVLRQDEKNVYTLANLGAIQIEMGEYDRAEKTITQALAGAPDDAYSLSLLGFLRFRQNRYDEALDALGRAAKLDSQNAEIQNYLGLTLGQKGMRTAAESALRRAIVLDPNYASAHYNLALVYLTQKPQRLELAQLHYRKALAAGMRPSVDMERMLGNVKAPETTP
jgi:Flp pilus assembly protein TadD